MPFQARSPHASQPPSYLIDVCSLWRAASPTGASARRRSLASIVMALAAGCVLFASFAAHAQKALPFSSAVAYLPGEKEATPIDVVTGDFNGDGLVDFAVVEQATAGDSVDVFLANGTGGFTLAQEIPLGVKAATSGSAFIANHIAVTGYFKGTSSGLGLAVASPSGFVVLTNNDSTTKPLTAQAPVFAPGACVSIAAAGFYKDASIDDVAVALGSGTKGSIALFKNPGSGDFSSVAPTYVTVTNAGKTVTGSILLAGNFALGSNGQASLALLGGSTVYVLQDKSSSPGSFLTLGAVNLAIGSFVPYQVTDLVTGVVNDDGNVDIVGLTQGGAQYLESSPVTPLGTLTMVSSASGTVLQVAGLDASGFGDFIIGAAPTILYDPTDTKSPPSPASSGPLAPPAQSIAVGLTTSNAKSYPFIVSVGQTLNPAVNNGQASFIPAAGARSIVVTPLPRDPSGAPPLNASGAPTIAPVYPTLVPEHLPFTPASPNNITTQTVAADENLLGTGVPGVAILGVDQDDFNFTVNFFEYKNAAGVLESKWGALELSENFQYVSAAAGGFTTGHFRGAAKLPDAALVVSAYSASGFGGEAGVIVLENNSGSFATPVAGSNPTRYMLPTPAGYVESPGTQGNDFKVHNEGSTLLATDINGDGYDDLVVLTPGVCYGEGPATVYAALSKGDGKDDFDTPLELDVTGLTNPISVAAGKFTGGAGEDLVIADAGSILTEYPPAVYCDSKTTGTPASVWLFKNKTTSPLAYDAGTKIWTAAPGASQFAQVSQVLAYPAATGSPDLLISAFDGLHVWENANDGSGFKPEAEQPAPLQLYGDDPSFSYAWQLALGNFTGTSPNEVAVASADVVYVYPVGSGGKLEAPVAVGAATSTPLAAGSGGYASQLKPVQRTGYLDDLMVTGASGFSALINGLKGPSDSLSATSLAFGSLAAGGVSAAKTITVTNTGNSAVTFGAVTLSGSGASSFTVKTDTCANASIAAGLKCSIGVEFTPQTAGALSAALSLSSNISSTPATVALSGTGTGAGASLSVAKLTFPSTSKGTKAAMQSVTLTNKGTAALTLNGTGEGITITGADKSSFTQGNNCGASVAALKSCTITVTFDPAATGSLSATLAIADNAYKSPQTVTLSGTGK